MAVGTREQLKQYALRALGAPVLEINVDEDQLEDRLDEALELLVRLPRFLWNWVAHLKVLYF